MSTPKTKNRSIIDLSNLVLALATIVLINVASSYVFERFDLTAEHRYSLSEVTKDQLESLDDIVFVRVYLEGNLPAEFKEMRDAVKETLDEFRAYAGANLEYEFINPSASSVLEEREAVYKELTKAGLQFTNIRMRTGDKVSEQIIFPGAIVTYRGQEMPIQLLKSQAGATEMEMIHASTQQLEYSFSSNIRMLTRPSKPRVAFIEGHGELEEIETADAQRALSEFYEVERIKIDGLLDALNGVDAIIIAQPDSAFDEKDKFVIDQFLMNGGRALWCIDPVFASMDSLKSAPFTLAVAQDINLADQLFKYGVRLNPDLILDLEALSIPVVTGQVGNQPRQEMFTWYYSPLVSGDNAHPISKSLDRIKTEFVSSIDTMNVPQVRKHILLTSSDKSKRATAPLRISLSMLRQPPRYESFNQGPFPVAVLLEGVFPSVFTNRLPKKIVENPEISFKASSENTKMIVVSDGDIIRNDVNKIDNRVYALGYDKYSNNLLGNREFLLNAMNYLCDDSGLVQVRSKEFKLRLMNQSKVDQERFFWQVLNTALPVLLILIFGSVRIWWRRRKYAR